MSKEEDLSKPKKLRRKVRRIFGCTLILFIILFVVGACIGLITITGYTKKAICRLSLDDSFLADELNCEDEEKKTTKEGVDKSAQEKIDEISSSTLEERIPKIVEVAQTSVVGIGIHSESLAGEQIVGTGFVITSEGLIATNQHVVSNPKAEYFVQVMGFEEVFEVETIYRDQINDIAVLKLEKPNGLNPLPLGDSSKIMVGQTVVAIGNPLGELQGTVTSGIISGLGREVQVSRGGFFNSVVSNYEDAIQTDAAINPGNSGGPLLDINGYVIGINFATVDGADNLSFALPINRIKNRLDQLEEFGEFKLPYLGVEYRTRVVFVQKQALVAAQVLVVAPDSPAEKGGIREGDFIVGFNGEDLDENNLFQQIQELEIGDEITLNILRNQKDVEVKVELGSRSSQ